MDQVMEELSNLAKDGEGALATRYLDKVPFEFGKAQTEVASSYNFLVYRRMSILQKLSDK